MFYACNAFILVFFFFNDTATTEIYTLSLHDALPIWDVLSQGPFQNDIPPKKWHISHKPNMAAKLKAKFKLRSEEHTSELQSRQYLVCRLLLEKKNKTVVRVVDGLVLGQYRLHQQYIE